ncbi:hypothetical protein D623_10010748 [Myotis brandtii]|uniref:Uncharacterized protein n=1 Tax=Myotis brandtii TaxID=109478 RepID=S7N3C1_MYOBR|nr:hypothetical protein D623_10010748 [Myotis brandtii]
MERIKRPWFLRATWMETVAERRRNGHPRSLRAPQLRVFSRRVPSCGDPRSPRAQKSTAIRSLASTWEGRATLCWLNVRKRPSKPGGQTAVRNRRAKVYFPEQVQQPQQPRAGKRTPAAKLLPGEFTIREWVRAASESEVSAVWGAPAVQYPGIPPTSRRKRTKSGAEPDRDLGGYSRSKTLEMAAKGAGSPDSSPRPFLPANPSPAAIQFTVYARRP